MKFYKIGLIILKSLAFFQNMENSEFKINGSIYLSNKSFDSLKINGSGNLKMVNIDILSVNGFLYAENSNINSLFTNGTVDLNFVKINDLNVNGNLILDHGKILEKAVISGEIEIKNSIIKNIEAKSKKIIIKKSEVNSIKVSEINKTIFSWFSWIPWFKNNDLIIELHDTIIHGDIIFEEKNGKVLIYGNSIIHGHIINGILGK